MNKLALLIGVAFLSSCVAPQSQYVKGDSEAVAKERELQREVALRTEATRTTRLLGVSYPLWTKNADLCGARTKHSLWLRSASAAELAKSKEFGPTVQRMYGVAEQQTILLVVPGSPIDVAGMKPGDVLKEVNGKPVAAGALVDADWKALRGADEAAPVTFGVQRGTERLILTATPIKACDYTINYVNNDALNAFANGEAVFITSGMMRFTESDHELALVLGHELAHNVRRHMDAKKTNAMGGMFFDILAAVVGVNTQGAFANAAGSKYSQEFESEADYVGLYYVARGGYDYKQASTFWRRMAAERACPRFCVNGHLAGNCHASRSDNDRREEGDQHRNAGRPAGRLQEA